MQAFDCEGTGKTVAINIDSWRSIQFQRRNAVMIGGKAQRHFFAVHIFLESFHVQSDLRGHRDESSARIGCLQPNETT